MDLFTRAIRGWHLSWASGKDLTLTALHKALQQQPAPDIHHSDQGRQYAAKEYVKRLQDAGTQISMTAAGEPSENGYAERVIRTIKEEECTRAIPAWPKHASNLALHRGGRHARLPATKDRLMV